ncbi:PP2C family protein-serine/threonine phosphatase [Sphingomonas mucosissima]|uniref:Serine/threonine phosphatase stp n=1 Tax=Sphingomonas mucosissima TaxID=370959 RepID=A0A245ZRE9_9SPHN|nr:protein phosphatase 2C domain-containing protein [Sphingomonas mucosissima]OWK32328.1 serine/threonine phosphatase stp [Sphingomonas mucosissima]
MLAKHRAWATTHAGLVRDRNEDSCQVASWRSSPAEANWRGSLATERLWAAVADGMGGHRRGELASSLVIDCIAEMIDEVSDDTDIHQLIAQANMRLFHAMAAPGGSPAMGSTVVGVVATGQRGWIFNVGDSRAYLLTGDEMQQVSVDHTPKLAAGDRRSHALTQSLGGTLTPIPLKAHVVSFDPRAVEAVLLCSDGLTDMVDDDEIEALVRRSPDDPAQALLGAALDAGGADNVTIVVVHMANHISR